MRSFYCFVLLFWLLSGVAWAQQEPAAQKNDKPQSQVEESEAFRTAARIQEPAQRLVALNKFLGDYPNTLLKPLVKMQIFRAMVESGANEKDYLPVAEEAMTTFPEIPQKAIALNVVAYTLAEAGKGLDLALKYAEQALNKYTTEDQNDQRATLQDTLGWVYFKRGNYPEAIKYLELAVQAAQDPDIQEHLAFAYEKAGQTDKAIDAFLNAVIFSGNETAKQRRFDSLRTVYSKKYGSDSGLEQRVADRKLTLLKNEALVKRRYEVAAPAWTLKDIKGETVRFADLRGKVLALYWWGSWCPPCQHTLPHFQRLYEAYKDKGVVFIGMNWERPGAPSEARIETARKFLKEKNYTFPVILDHEMKAGTEYKVETFPTIFIIDRNGQIRYRTDGYSPDIGEILEVEIQTELAREETKSAGAR
jgi:peroxiredoxin